MINLKYFEMNGHIVGLGRELLDESKSVVVARKAIQSQFTGKESGGVCDDLVRMRQLLYTAPSSNQIPIDSDRIQNRRNRIQAVYQENQSWHTVKQGSMSVMFD